MSRVTQASIMEEAARRRQRIFGYITQDPPMPVATILEIEGIGDRTARQIIRELEEEHGTKLKQFRLKKPRDELPYGITPATARMRQRLGDALYLLRERGNDSNVFGRNSVAPLVGMNSREQIKAEQRPFNHDWKLSQIERLARELNRDPRELLLSCLTG